MNAKLLSPAQAAQLLGIGASTLRLWSEQFKDHLSATAQGGGKRRRHYTAEDMATLARARDLLRSGSTVTEVNARLGLVDASRDSGGALVTVGIADELQSTRATLAAMRDEWQSYRAQQDTMLATLTAELEAMRAEVEALKARPHWWQRFTRR